MRRFVIACSVAFSIALAGCSAVENAPALTTSHLVPLVGEDTLVGRLGPGAMLKHVVIIVQENRSFDNLFQGYPGANTVSSGQDSKGRTIPLRPVSLSTAYIVDHSSLAFFAACNGTGSLPGTDCRMNGFNREYTSGGPAHAQYAYAPHADVRPYFDIAHEFVVNDNTFTSQLDESFVAHQYLIAGRAQRAVDLPTSTWGCGGGKSDTVATLTESRTYGPSEQVCFNEPTLGDELDAAGLTWRYYTTALQSMDCRTCGIGSGSGSDGWSAYQAIRHIRYGADWSKNVITPQAQFLTDIANGTLANVTWITPTCANSDHVACGGGTGPQWVASLVNAVGESPFWRSTAVFVVWDDWGGLYDHVPPPYADYDGLGIRVPLLVASAYAKHDYVSHAQYETASILRFTEDVFGLPRLAASDRRAASPAKDCFDFRAPPRRFVPIKTSLDPRVFLQSTDHTPPDYE